VIDGPAGAGKSTVARAIAQKLGAALLDTGAIYRSLAWLARERGVSWDDELRLAELAAMLQIEFRPAPEPGPQIVSLLGAGTDQGGSVEVTSAIREPEISEGASQVSRHPQVRAALMGIQRGIAARAVERGGCVAEGRDMGTVVFPDSPHKFFLTASVDTRAGRRYAELLAKGHVDTTRDQVAVEMIRRDERDSSRDVAPLVQAEDAVRVDSSALGSEQVVALILGQVRARGRSA